MEPASQTNSYYTSVTLNEDSVSKKVFVTKAKNKLLHANSLRAKRGYGSNDSGKSRTPHIIAIS